MSLKVLTLTWNTSGEDTSRSEKAWKASDVGIRWSEWLRGRTRTNEALQHGTGTFDVVVLCLQEVHRKNEFAEFFLAELNNSLPKARKTPAQLEAQKFTMAVAKNKSLARLVGESFDQHLYVFYKVKDGFSVAKRGSTCFGKGGTCVKGSVGIHLHRTKEHYLFVCSHFPLANSTREPGDIARTAAYRSTEDKLIKELSTIGGTMMDKVTIVWAGDFNYRTDIVNWPFGKKLPQKQGDLYRDRLSILRAKGPADPWSHSGGWRECTEPKELTENFKPNYQPTCRMVQLSKTASVEEIKEQGLQRHEGLRDAYTLITKKGKARKPAWCDRVFIKPLDVANLTCKSNKFSTGAVESDHDAVFAELELKDVVIGEPVPQALIEEWHDFTDELNQSNDSESIGVRVASVNWKSILMQHAQLLIDRNWNIALNKDVQISEGNKILATNAGRWKMVRANNTQEFMQMLNSYNREIREAMLFIRQGEDDPNYLNALKRSAEIMGETIPEFLAKRALLKRLKREEELKRAFGDYDEAIKFHLIAVNNAIESLKLPEQQRETFRHEETFQRDEALKNAANVANLLSKHVGFLSEELADEESLIQSNDSELIEVRLRSVDWTPVLEEHSSLVMEKTWAIARDADIVSSLTSRMSVNIARWELTRSSTTRDLQSRVRIFNDAVSNVERALSAARTGTLDLAKQTLRVNAEQLATFLAKHKPFRSSAQLTDYTSAFKAYSECLLQHAVAVNRVLRAKQQADITAALKNKMQVESKCRKIARAVAVVLNGGTWSTQLSEERIQSKITIGLCSRDFEPATILHKTLHDTLVAMKAEKDILTVFLPLLGKLLDALEGWMRSVKNREWQITILYARIYHLTSSIGFLISEMKKSDDISLLVTWKPIKKLIKQILPNLHLIYAL